jgi:hypothetical protein
VFVSGYTIGVATLALGSRPRQRGYKVAGQEEAWKLKQEEARELRQEEARESRQEEARESHHILPGMLESVREYEGVNPHTPKVTPTLGDGVPVDSRNFIKRFQGSNLNVLWRFLYRWKALGA